MEQKIIAERTENNISLKCGETIWETYSFAATIDFRGLTSHLIGDELNSKFLLVDQVSNKTSQEQKLVSLILLILQKYNDRVDALNAYKAQTPKAGI